MDLMIPAFLMGVHGALPLVYRCHARASPGHPRTCLASKKARRGWPGQARP
jgi:hypothetical protein